MKSSFDVIIIGAGAAGMSAAIYLKRSNVDVVMIEASAPGGQINRTAKVENYPGADIIDGPDLAMKMFQQTQNLGIEYRYGQVIEIKKEESSFIIKTDVETLTSKAVIIATGRKPKFLGIENEKELTGKGISWCAICDGPFFRNKEVVVVGGGNSALEESLYLADMCSKVTIVHRRDSFRADKIIQGKVLNNEKIKVMFDSEITKFYDQNNKLISVDIKNKVTNENKNIKCDGAFIYIGFEPITDIIKDFNITDDNGYIIADENQRTSIPGIYACGDVTKKELYQIVTATAEGAKAAMSAIKDLS
jgi:thioredoxin reductase (NADPH)